MNAKCHIWAALVGLIGRIVFGADIHFDDPSFGGGLQSGAHIVLEPGEYHFGPESVQRICLNPSNNASGEKNVAFCMRGLSNVEIDGQGSTFVFHDGVFPFAAIGCTNIAIRNIVALTDRPPYVSFVVGRKDDDGFEIALENAFSDLPLVGKHLCFHSLDRNFQDYYISPSDPESRDWVPTKYISGDVERKDVRRYYFRYHPESHKSYSRCRFAEGERVCLNLAGNREQIFFFAQDCKNVTLESVKLPLFGGMGIVAQRTEDIIIKRYVVLPDAEKGLPVTLTADAMHFINCGGKIRIEDCEVAETLDDVCNVHGNYLKVLSTQRRAVALEVGHFEQAGFFPCRDGDEVEFIHPATRDVVARRRVVAFRPQSDKKALIEVDGELGDLPSGCLVEDVTLCPDVEIRNNYFHDFPHMRLSGRGKMIVEGNRIERCEDGLLALDLADYWYESGRIEDLTIRSNTFYRCSSFHSKGPYIRIGLNGDERDDLGAPKIHGRIRLIGNTYPELEGAPFKVCGVRDFTGDCLKMAGEEQIENEIGEKQ